MYDETLFRSYFIRNLISTTIQQMIVLTPSFRLDLGEISRIISSEYVLVVLFPRPIGNNIHPGTY